MSIDFALALNGIGEANESGEFLEEPRLCDATSDYELIPFEAIASLGL